MSTMWDERIDPLFDRRRDERVLPREIRQTITDADGRCDTPGCACGGRRPLCEGCGEPCDPQDWADFDGHGPQCPSGDPACELRVCDPRNDDPAHHVGCETQADRDTRDAVAREQALREQAAEWRAEDGL